MRLKSVALVCGMLCILLNSPNLQADEPRVITILEAIKISLQENIGLKQFSNLVARSKISVAEARADFYPNLTASSHASKEYRKDDGSLPVQSRSGKSLDARISTQVNLFDGFRKFASLQQAKLVFSADEADYNRRCQYITYLTISQYLKVLQNSELIRIEKENLSAQQQQLKQIEEFYRAGRRSKADVLLQRADIKKSELRVLNAQRDFELRKIDLLLTLGQQSDVDFEFADLDVSILISSFINRDIKVIKEKVFAQRPDYKAQQKQVEVAKKGVKKARSGYWPSLSFHADVGSSYQSSNPLSGFSDQFFDRNLEGSIGLTLTIPIFDQHKTKYNVEKANIYLEDEQISLKNLNLEIDAEVKQAFLEYQTSVKQREVTQTQYDYTQEALNVTQERYTVGAATYIELSQARAQNVSAAYDRISADHNLLLKYMAVHFYYGDIDSAISLFNKE